MANTIEQMLGSVSTELVGLGQKLVSVSLSSAVDAFTVLVYLVVVPLLVFFLLNVVLSLLAYSQ